MSGIKVPGDRTLMQPVVAFCRNPECMEESGKRFEFYVENDRFVCPKCGGDKPGMVAVKVLTHLLIPHNQGPVRGQGGRRFVIACDDKRAYLATATNLEAATDQEAVANCPGCLENAKHIDPERFDKQRIFIVPSKSAGES